MSNDNSSYNLIHLHCPSSVPCLLRATNTVMRGQEIIVRFESEFYCYYTFFVKTNKDGIVEVWLHFHDASTHKFINLQSRKVYEAACMIDPVVDLSGQMLTAINDENVIMFYDLIFEEDVILKPLKCSTKLYVTDVDDDCEVELIDNICNYKLYRIYNIDESRFLTDDEVYDLYDMETFGPNYEKRVYLHVKLEKKEDEMCVI